MNTETSQKMTYQEREALKGFTDKRALQGDTQSLQMTLRMIAHWMRQPAEIDLQNMQHTGRQLRPDVDDGNHSTVQQWRSSGL